MDFIENPKNIIDELTNIHSLSFLIDEYSCYDLWKEVALDECKQYLLHKMSNMGFSFDIGEKTECVLNDLLNESLYIFSRTI